MCYNELYDACLAKLYKGGYRIHTSFDMEKQQQLQDSVDEALEDFTDTADDGKYKLQGAAVCIDNSTGQVVAMVGGRSQEDLDAGLTLNRAFQSHRQPGSSIKPLVVYTPAFERGYYPGTLVEDKEIEDGPENSGGGYMGELELSEAVQRSLNTVAWQIYDDISPRYGLSKLKGMHFSMIVDSDNTLATSLGGFTYGVEPVEMASGYATLFNDGKYRIPSCITSIEDYQGTTDGEPAAASGSTTECPPQERPVRQTTPRTAGSADSPIIIRPRSGSAVIRLNLCADCRERPGRDRSGKTS